MLFYEYRIVWVLVVGKTDVGAGQYRIGNRDLHEEASADHLHEGETSSLGQRKGSGYSKLKAEADGVQIEGP